MHSPSIRTERRALHAHPSAPAAGAASRLVVHVIDSLAAGRAGQGLLNLLSHLPQERYRHAIVCLDNGETDAAPDGPDRIAQVPGVDIVRLPRLPGRAESPPYPLHYLRLFRLLRAMRPDLVHTRGRASLWVQAVAALAGVGMRVHAEPALDGGGVDAGIGERLLHRLVAPLVDHFIAGSADAQRWLVQNMGAAPARLSQLADGVDSVRFHPRLGPPAALGPPGFMRDDVFVIGSVGRMDAAGNYGALVDAFLRLIASPHPAHGRLRLLIAGDGPARAECQAVLERAGVAERAWLPGASADLPQLLRAMDVFVMPSLRDACPNKILEAMATGLPVVATAVGSHPALVHPGFTGILVPPLSTDMLASAMADYCRIPDMAARHGARARSQVMARHSMPALARDVLAIYDALSCPPDDDAWRVA